MFSFKLPNFINYLSSQFLDCKIYFMKPFKEWFTEVIVFDDIFNHEKLYDNENSNFALF